MSHRQIASCVLENFCENPSLRNRILSLQQVEKNQIRLNLCDLLRRQNSVATHEAICRCKVSTRHVAATYHLVCTDLKATKSAKIDLSGIQPYLVLDVLTNPDRVTLTKKVTFGKNPRPTRFLHTTLSRLNLPLS